MSQIWPLDKFGHWVRKLTKRTTYPTAYPTAYPNVWAWILGAALLVVALAIQGIVPGGLPGGAPPAWALAAANGRSGSPATPAGVETVDRPASLPETEGLSAEQLNHFVQAYLQVFSLLEQREGDLQAAETESESLRIQREIEIEAYRRIEATGLSRQAYLQILRLANVDSELGEQIAAQLQEAQQ